MTSNRWFAVAMVLLIVTVSFASVASAQETGTSDQYSQTYQTYKEKYIEAKDIYIQAKNEFESAKANYRTAKTKGNSEALLNSAKDYMVKAIDAMIAYLRLIEANANLAENRGIAPYDASDNLNKYISELEQKKLEVQSATTKQELIDVGKSVKETWQNVRAEVKYYIGYVVNNRLEEFLIKANNASERIDSQIQTLKSKGIDTTKLESDLATYNEWVSKAETEYNSAKENYKTHGGFDTYGHVTNMKEADQFLNAADKNFRQANQYLIKAKNSLKEAIAELRKANKT